MAHRGGAILDARQVAGEPDAEAVDHRCQPLASSDMAKCPLHRRQPRQLALVHCLERRQPEQPALVHLPERPNRPGEPLHRRPEPE